MTVAQMVCHCTDAFLLPLGERPAKRAKTPPIPLGLYKWIALNTPMQWPKGIKSVPEMIQGLGGTPPTDFVADRVALLRVLDRFAERRGSGWPPHPFFGEMTAAEWLRWGYLHSDHHLRQFGR